jgi:MFS family permease
MGFFRAIYRNHVTCAVSIILLNYNIAITSYVLRISTGTDDTESDVTALSKSWASCSLVVGLLMGQLVFGVCSDLVMSRRVAFLACCVLMVLGTLLGILPDITTLYFSVCRFVLGLGAGGTIANCIC